MAFSIRFLDVFFALYLAINSSITVLASFWGLICTLIVSSSSATWRLSSLKYVTNQLLHQWFNMRLYSTSAVMLNTYSIFSWIFFILPVLVAQLFKTSSCFLSNWATLSSHWLSSSSASLTLAHRYSVCIFWILFWIVTSDLWLSILVFRIFISSFNLSKFAAFSWIILKQSCLFNSIFLYSSDKISNLVALTNRANLCLGSLLLKKLREVSWFKIQTGLSTCMFRQEVIFRISRTVVAITSPVYEKKLI